MKRLYSIISFTFLIVAGVSAQQIPFQGRLLDDGRPFNGTATIDFNIATPAWSETKSNVSVVDGYYSVVLGSDTPLPEDLFGDNREISMDLTVNGEDLGSVTLHSPLLPYTGTQPVEIDSIVSASVNILGINDDTKVRLLADNNGYDGTMILVDSLNRTGAFMTTDRGTGTGGYIQLNGRDNVSGDIQSAVVTGTITQGRQNSFMDLYGGNSTGDGPQLMVDAYVSDTDQFGTPNSDGYRRGGIDIYNYNGNFTHNIFSSTDPGGSDPTGFSGQMNLYGTNTPNISLAADQFANNDLGHLNIYGQNDDGGSWAVTNIGLHANDISGNSGGVFFMGNSQNGGIFNETVFVSSYGGDAEGGYFTLRDATGSADRVSLNGGSGNISANRTDGGSAANFFVATDNGGIAIQNSSDVNKLFYEAGSGSLNLNNDGGTNTIALDGNLGNIFASGDVSGNTLTSSDGMVQTSDRRLKKNIQNLNSPLEKTIKMRGVSYQWKDENKSQRNQIGVIAQEVEAVYPEFVITNENGMKAVNYAQMTAVLIEAMKELNAKVNRLESENANLKASLNEVKELRSQVDQMMKILGGSKAASK